CAIARRWRRGGGGRRSPRTRRRRVLAWWSARRARRETRRPAGPSASTTGASWPSARTPRPNRQGDHPRMCGIAGLWAPRLDPRGLAFASEPGALTVLPWVSREPAPAALARYLAHGFFAGEDCAFAALRQVPPAHTLVFGEGLERRTRYWRPWDAIVGAAREG